jgi:hypothetical protein
MPPVTVVEGAALSGFGAQRRVDRKRLRCVGSPGVGAFTPFGDVSATVSLGSGGGRQGVSGGSLFGTLQAFRPGFRGIAKWGRGVSKRPG